MTEPNPADVLKPCPFCGGEAWLVAPQVPMEADCCDVYVTCGACDAQGPSSLFDQHDSIAADLDDVISEAIAAWNTRAALQEQSNG